MICYITNFITYMNLYKFYSNPEELDHYHTLGKKLDDNGCVVYRNETGQIHRDNDLPAVFWFYGHKEWRINGKLHRDNDKPAIIWSNGIQQWYINGKLHRDDDKPAVIGPDGRKEWYKNGEYHRDNDEPAVIYADGRNFWYKNGMEYLPDRIFK